MAWCHQATSHCLSQCWPSSMSLYDIPGVNKFRILVKPCLYTKLCNIHKLCVLGQRYNSANGKAGMCWVIHNPVHGAVWWWLGVGYWVRSRIFFICYGGGGGMGLSGMQACCQTTKICHGASPIPQMLCYQGFIHQSLQYKWRDQYSCWNNSLRLSDAYMCQ